MEALLGEGRLTERYAAELARDWFDVFLVGRVGSDTDIQIRQGKNLLGISYDVDLTNVVTRIMPTGETEDGEVLYLDELYLDSPHIGRYPHPKWIHLPVSEAKVSDDLTLEQAKTKMREAAQAEFDNGCDLPTVTLNVDFINCTDTEEYKPYGFLQNIFLGDSVRVIARRIGVEVSMRMTQYSYDCLIKKYTSMTLGTVADTVESNMISARQLGSGIITGAKLAINSVGSGQLQNSSVGSLQIKMAAIGTAHIADAAITRAKIAEATVGTLNAEALTAVTAKIEELSAGNLITDASVCRTGDHCSSADHAGESREREYQLGGYRHAGCADCGYCRSADYSGQYRTGEYRLGEHRFSEYEDRGNRFRADHHRQYPKRRYRLGIDNRTQYRSSQYRRGADHHRASAGGQY